jgi:hypothetical protein
MGVLAMLPALFAARLLGFPFGERGGLSFGGVFEFLDAFSRLTSGGSS